MIDAFGVEISKGMPKAARAIGNDLLRNPEHNFAPFSEIISPKKTNYVVLRHNSYRRGREAAKTYAKLKQDPLKPDPYGLTPATRTTINRDFGRNSKLGFGPQDIASGHLHRFTGVTKPADIGGKTGWKAMLNENNAKKLPNVNRDNYISQRPKASQDKLRAFIKRRDRKARGDISKGLRVNLPVKWVERIADSHTRDARRIKAVADQMSHPEHGYNKPVEIAFSRKHNNYYDLVKPNERIKLRLQNGHHRLAAHKLLGRKKIYVDITLRRQQTQETIRGVPKGKGFGPNKNMIFSSKVKPPTFSPKNVAVGTAVVGAGGTGIVYAKKKR